MSDNINGTRLYEILSNARKRVLESDIPVSPNIIQLVLILIVISMVYVMAYFMLDWGCM